MASSTELEPGTDDGTVEVVHPVKKMIKKKKRPKSTVNSESMRIYLSSV